MKKYGYSFVGFGNCRDSRGYSYDGNQKNLDYAECASYCQSFPESKYLVGLWRFLNHCRCLFEDGYAPTTVDSSTWNYYSGKGEISSVSSPGSSAHLCYKLVKIEHFLKFRSFIELCIQCDCFSRY